MNPSRDTLNPQQAAERAFALGAFGAAYAHATNALVTELSDEQDLQLTLLKLQSVAPNARGASFCADLDTVQYLATEQGDVGALLKVHLLRLEYLRAQNRVNESDVLKTQIKRLLVRINDPLIQIEILEQLALSEQT